MLIRFCNKCGNKVIPNSLDRCPHCSGELCDIPTDKPNKPINISKELKPGFTERLAIKCPGNFGFLGLTIACLGVFITVLGMWGMSESFSRTEDKIFGFLFVLIGGFLIYIGNYLWRIFKRAEAKNINKIFFEKRQTNINKMSDEQSAASVLYLRSFDDDTIMDKIPDELATLWVSVPETNLFNIIPPDSEEVQLVKVLSNIGTVKALGRPGEFLSQQGAKRTYVKDKEWKETVLKFMSRAKLVVICAGLSTSLKWEISMAARFQPEKLVFLIPTKLNYAEFVRESEKLIPWHFPQKKGWLTAGSFSGLVCFDENGHSDFISPKYSPFRTHIRKPVYSHFTFMLKPVFNRLHIPWKKPALGFVFWGMTGFGSLIIITIVIETLR